MKFKIKLLFFVLLGFLLKSSAQDIFVASGKVKNKLTGESLVGVTVQSDKTNKTTSTDKTGSFTLPTQVGSTITFSYIGMATIKYVVKNNDNIKIDMVEETKAGDEVIVIGYGTQKKSVVTGSISSVKASDLENQVTPRIEEALQGRTSGVTIASSSGSPGAGSSIYIRGVTSINGSDPLYVVDGVPISGGIDYLNPGDILSIELLKDGASAAIYGTKAATGVILVTTKKGKAGNFQFNVSGYNGTQAPARKLDLLNATQYATLRNESSLAAGTGIVFANPKSLGTGTDWQSTIFNNSAKIQNYQVSISGGNEKSTYYGSLGYFNQDGIVATSISNYKRFTASFNSSVKINPWLNFGNNVSYAYVKSQGGLNTNSEYGGPLSSAINLDPITKTVITDAATLATSPYKTSDSLPLIRDANGNPYGISKYVGQEMTNPLANIQTHQGNYGFANNFVGNVYLEVEPIKGLKFKTNIGAKMAFFGSESFTPIYYLSSTVNNLAQNSYSRDYSHNLNWNWDNTASYTKSFGYHNFTALLGTGAQDFTGSDVNATYFGLPVNNFNDASMNYSINSANRLGGGYEYAPYRLSSIYGRITYDYNGRYLFTGIVRRDGSSHFGDNKKYGTFPSVSLGWVPSKENFWKKGYAVNFLKIRGSYGVNGNDNIPAFAYQGIIGSGGNRNYTIGNGAGQQIGYSPDRVANPDLQWEQTTQTNLGFDATFLKYFNITFDAYDKKTTKMLLALQIPGYVGAGIPIGNIASLENKGLELELGFNKKVKDVTISLKGNISYIKNEITDLGQNAYLTGAAFQSSNYELSRTAVGQPLGAFYGFKTMGIFQSQQEINSYLGKGGKIFQPNAKPGDFKYANISGDSTLSANDRTYIGDPTPHWSFGFTATANWKGFDLLVFAQGVTGNKIFQGLRRLDIANSNYSTKALSRWTGPGTSNDYPRLVDGDPNGNFSNPSDFYLEDGSYLRIKTLQIGYTLPKSLVQKLGLQKAARIYISSNNLVTITRYSGYDPEIGGSSYGIDRGIYPQARSFLVGVNITL